MTSKMIFTLVITVTLMLNLVSSSVATNRPAYIECQNNDECAPGFCCLLMPDRYSTPKCVTLREEGEMCRPNASTMNTTVSYPDGIQLELTNVHYITCPCSNGLTCAPHDGICREHSPKNDILEESNTQVD